MAGSTHVKDEDVIGYLDGDCAVARGVTVAPSLKRVDLKYDKYIGKLSLTFYVI